MKLEQFSSALTSMGLALANHVWQSTIFAALIALLTLPLRKYQAQIRFSLWLAASIKFLVPFSLIVMFADALLKPQHTNPGSQTAFYAAINVASQPFTVGNATPIGSNAHHLRRL